MTHGTAHEKRQICYRALAAQSRLLAPGQSHPPAAANSLDLNPTISQLLNTTQIEIRPPQRFTGGVILAITACGSLVAIPILASCLAVTLFGLGPATILIPLLTVTLTAWCLPPSALENAFIARLMRVENPPATKGLETFRVQLTLAPRIRSGLQALAEDADDFGHLTFTDFGLVYEGDAVKLRVPFSQISAVRRRNIGMRGLFVYGPRLVVVARGLGDFQFFELGERSSWVLPTSRRISRTIFERLSSKVATTRPPG